MTEVSSGISKPCQFPFVYLNKTFNGCTKIETFLVSNGEYTFHENPWCSTKTETGTNLHIQGQNFYGECPSSCEVEIVDTSSPFEKGKDPTVIAIEKLTSAVYEAKVPFSER